MAVRIRASVRWHPVRMTSDEISAVTLPEWSWDPTLYAGSARFYAVGRVGYPVELVEVLVDALALDGSGRLLDVGCGPGSLTLLLASHFAEAIGVDADGDMLGEAARLAEHQKPAQRPLAPAARRGAAGRLALRARRDLRSIPSLDRSPSCHRQGAGHARTRRRRGPCTRDYPSGSRHQCAAGAPSPAA
jgi:SAM-dependent methyltransferase